MTDVEKLLTLHQLATELGALEQAPEFEFAGIGDLDLIKAVAIDIYRIDGDWNDADTLQRVHAYKIAHTAITSFVRQILRSA
jgi:hypothetical protein